MVVHAFVHFRAYLHACACVVVDAAGVVGVPQGAGPTVLKLTLNMGMRFTFFGWLRDQAMRLNGGAPMSDLQSFLAGGVSGAVSVVVNHPVDVVVSWGRSIGLM
jgi:hypothetical protein